MVKQKKSISLVLLYLMVSVIFIVPELTYPVDEAIEEKLESIDNLLPDSPSNDISPSTKQSVVDPNIWYEGETITTDIEFNAQIPEERTLSADGEIEINNMQSINIYRALSAGTWFVPIYFGSQTNDYYFNIHFWIYCGGSGELETSVSGAYGVGGAWFSAPSGVDTLTVTSDYLDSQGYLYMMAQIYVLPSTNTLTLYVWYYDTGSYTLSQIIYDTEIISSFSTYDSVQFAFGDCYFTRDTITNNIRSEKKYSSDSLIIYGLTIPSVPHAKEINIYYPEHLTYSFINPYASVTDSSYTLTINSPTELTYYVTFNSKTENYLPLTDVTNRLLSHNGFEDGQYLTDWTNSPSYLYEDISLETSITYDGYYSLKLTQSSGSAGNIMASIDGGLYYVTASIYIESISGGDENIYLDWTNGTWQFEYFDTTILNKWQPISFYCNLIDISDNFGLRVDATTAIFYFDFSSLFLSHSATIQNINSKEQLITIDYLNLDGYKNPSANYYGVTARIYNSSTDVLITNTTGYTDEFGSFEWTTNLSLVQDEYYIHISSNPIQDPVGFSMKLALNPPIYPVEVKTLSDAYRPNDVGTTTDLSAYGAGSYNWDRVDEVSADDDTTYVGVSAGTLTDTYNIPDHTTENGIINHVTVWIRVKKVTGASQEAWIVIRSGGTDYAQSVAINFGWTDFSYQWTDNPADSQAWEWSDIDALEIGVKLLYDTGSPRCTQVWMFVDYTPDIIDPVISSPDDERYELESTNNDLTWTVTESNPDTYIIYRNDENVESGSYSSGVPIVHDIDGLAVGIYNFTIWADDIAGNSATDLVWVTVWEVEIVYYFTPQSIPETPTLNELDLSFYLSSTNNSFSYDIYLDDSYLDIYSDLETILKNNTVGDHNLTYVFFSSSDSYVYDSSTYSYLYSVDPSAFSVNIESFYLSDLYVNTYLSSNYDFDYYVYEDNDPAGDGSGYKEGTAISSNRDTTEGVTISYAIKFVYSAEIVWFNISYSNSRSAFYVEEYKIDKGEENIQIIWSTTKPTIDSLTVYEGTVLKVDGEEDSPSSWAKSTTIGVHYVTLIFEAVTYGSIIYSFNYEIVAEVFEVNVESFHLSEEYVNTYITASENGNYQVFENNTAITSPATFYYVGTSIQTDRNTTEGAFINYAIKFWNTAEDTIWFNTTYSNTLGDFFVNDYSINLGETTITVTWATSLPDSDYITVKEDGVTKVAIDEASPTDWAKSTVVGTHVVTLLFQAAGYTTITYSFNYPVYAVADFQVDVGSFQVSDDYVNTYVSSNYDGNYYVYEDNVQIDTGILYGAGTVVETSRDTTEGVTISYAIKFVYETIEVWFNTTYSNPVTPFYLTDYRVTDGSTIVITWDSTLPALDSLTIYEDGDLKVNTDPSSTTSWTKSTEVGNHYVTLIFSATDYTDIIHSFSYTVYPPIAFSIFIDTFYVTDDYVNMYLTANYDYTYTVYENTTEIGSGNGMAVGTTIISPKNRAAGLYNFTIIFIYNSETIPFMTWYSNLIPPNHPLNDLWRMESQGFYNISIHSNLDSYWIDIYHDDSLIIDDSIADYFSIEKGLRVGWHNITLHYIYNVSTDSEGYPMTEYNITLVYEFWYETTFFYDVKLRYVPNDLGLAIGEFNVNWVKTYLDGTLIQQGEIDDVELYSNYTFISNYNIRIKNTAATHTLVVKDLFDRSILSTTLDISSFTYKVITLPIYRLGVINWDNETHKFGVIAFEDFLKDKPWKLSPELPRGVFIEFWFCDVIYLFRVYSATEYIDEDGNKSKLWNTWVDLPPGRLPRSFEIPLTYDGTEEEEQQQQTEKLDTIIYIVIPVLVVLIIIFIIVWRIRKKLKKR